MGSWNEFVKAFTRDRVVMCGLSVQDLQETGQWCWCKRARTCKFLGQWSCATFLWRQGEKHKPQHRHLGFCICKGQQQPSSWQPPPFTRLNEWRLNMLLNRVTNTTPKHWGTHTWVRSQCLKTYLSMKSKRLINCFWKLISSMWCQLSSCNHVHIAVSLSLVPHPNRICTQSFRGEEQIPALRSAQGCKGYAAPNVRENSNSMLNNWFDVYVSHRLFSVGHHPPIVLLFPRNALKRAHLWCPADMNIPTFVKYRILLPLVF